MQFPDSKIILFARAPVAGQVKTRLAESIGQQEALRVHQQLLDKTLGLLINAGLAPVCCYTTDPENHYFTRWKNSGVEICQQQGHGLGQRMSHAISQVLINASPVLLLGSDCPVLSVRHLREAFSALQAGDDAVLIPAEDGGYVLLGLKACYPEVFEQVDWSTEKVLQQTLHRFNKLQLEYKLLETLWDVDTRDDYRRALEDNRLDI